LYALQRGGKIQPDKYLSVLTRRLGLLGVRGTRRLVDPIRRHYAALYAKSNNPYALIEDFDSDLALRLNRASYLDSLIYWLGYHSYDERKLLGRLLQPSDVFVDVGANVGEITLFAAKRSPLGKVLSFEPLSSAYRQLQENIALNSFENILTFDIALSDSSGQVPLYTSNLEEWHLGSMFQSSSRAKAAQTIRTERFDEVFSKTGLERLNAMKLDVEGAEIFVLKGAEEALREYKPILIMEANNETYTAAGYSYADILGFLRNLEYCVSLVRPGGHFRRKVGLERVERPEQIPPLATLFGV
jgi:FkbM family methyltransferase